MLKCKNKRNPQPGVQAAVYFSDLSLLLAQMFIIYFLILLVHLRPSPFWFVLPEGVGRSQKWCCLSPSSPGTARACQRSKPPLFVSQRPGHGLQLCHAPFSPMSSMIQCMWLVWFPLGAVLVLPVWLVPWWLSMEERVPLALGWDTRLAQTTSSILCGLIYCVKN